LTNQRTVNESVAKYTTIGGILVPCSLAGSEKHARRFDATLR